MPLKKWETIENAKIGKEERDNKFNITIENDKIKIRSLYERLSEYEVTSEDEDT
jgi:hypothetical protein